MLLVGIRIIWISIKQAAAALGVKWCQHTFTSNRTEMLDLCQVSLEDCLVIDHRCKVCCFYFFQVETRFKIISGSSGTKAFPWRSELPASTQFCNFGIPEGKSVQNTLTCGQTVWMQKNMKTVKKMLVRGQISKHLKMIFFARPDLHQ